jgi:hypothetical protein
MNKLVGRSKMFLRKNGSTILTCVGSAGVVVTAVMAVKATPKAMQLIKAAEEEKGEKLTGLETIAATRMTYAPTAIAGIATISCILGANVLNKRTQASLVSAYALLDQKFKDYKKKVEELHGEETSDNIREQIVKDKYPDCNIKVGDDAKLFYDFYSGRYFESTMADVLAAEYELNRRITLSDSAYLNDWYEELGLEPIDGGYELGWSRGFNSAAYWQEWVDFNHKDVEMEGGLECCIVTFMQDPSIDFADYI